MFDGEALVGPGMKDARLGQPLGREPVDPVPPGTVLTGCARVSMGIQSTMMWYRNAAKTSRLVGTA